MTRFITPAFLGGVAIAVAIYNQRPDRKVVFPLLDLLTRDPATQGWITVGLLAGIAALTGLSAILSTIRSRRED